MRLSILGQIPIFQDLSAAELGDLADRMLSLSWAPGDALFTTGESSTHVFVLTAGQARTFRSTPAGQATSLDFLGSGDPGGGRRGLGADRGRFPGSRCS